MYPEGYVPPGQQPLVPPPEQTPQPPNPKDTIAAKGKSDAKGSKDAKGKDGGGGKKVEAGKMTDAKGKDVSAGAKNADSAGKKGSESKEKDGTTKKEDVKPEPKLETKKGGKKKGDKKGEEEPVVTEDRGVQADVPEEVRNLLPYFKVLASTPHQPCFPPILHIVHMWVFGSRCSILNLHQNQAIKTWIQILLLLFCEGLIIKVPFFPFVWVGNRNGRFLDLTGIQGKEQHA